MYLYIFFILLMSVLKKKKKSVGKIYGHRLVHQILKIRFQAYADL